MTENLTTRPSRMTRERVLTLRVDFHTFDTIKRAAKARNVTVSELVRDYLSCKK